MKSESRSREPAKAFNFIIDISGWNRFGIAPKGSKILKEVEDDLRRYSVELDDGLSSFAVLKEICVDIIKLDKATLVQEYSFSLHFTVPISGVSDFKHLLLDAEDYDFDSYSWGDFALKLCGIGAPTYLIQENERSYGNARNIAPLRRLWTAMYGAD